MSSPPFASPPTRARSLTGGAVVVVLALFFLGVRWNTFTAPFERDEGEYAYSAWLLRQGLLPYENAFLQKPPAIVYTYALGQAFSEQVWPPRVLAALFLAGAVLCLARWAEREQGRGAGLIAAALAVPLFATPALLPFAANTEVFMLLPLLAALAIQARAHGRATPREWLAWGALAAASLLYKPIDALVLAFAGLVWSAETWRETRSPKALAVRFGAATAGGLLVAAVMLAQFLWHDGGRSLWEAVVAFNRYYARVGAGSTIALRRNLALLWPSWWLVLLLAGASLLRRPPRWWLPAGLAVAALLGIYPTPNSHYYILVVPFVAVAAAGTIQAAVAWIAARQGEPRARLAGAGLLAAAAAVLAWPLRDVVTQSPQTLQARLYGADNAFAESPAVARRLAELTRPGDYVYVAGSEPQILYYARRRSATPFVIAYPLLEDTPFAAAYQMRARADLEARPPAAIVYARSPLSWLTRRRSPAIFAPYVRARLDREYRLVGGFSRRPGVGWEEPLPMEHIADCSLLLFLRNPPS